MARYDLGVPDESEPGSDGRVLRNRRGITDPDEIGTIEAILLARAQARSFDALETAAPITVALVRELHRSWLVSLYLFAGELRTVDVSKAFVRFAPVAYLDSTL